MSAPTALVGEVMQSVESVSLHSYPLTVICVYAHARQGLKVEVID